MKIRTLRQRTDRGSFGIHTELTKKECAVRFATPQLKRNHVTTLMSFASKLILFFAIRPLLFFFCLSKQQNGKFRKICFGDDFFFFYFTDIVTTNLRQTTQQQVLLRLCVSAKPFHNRQMNGRKVLRSYNNVYGSHKQTTRAPYGIFR